MYKKVDGMELHKTKNVVLKRPDFEGDVLVCEDNSMDRLVICEHLARVGLKSFVAINGKRGVEMVRKRLESGVQPFDLIFMDIHMPETDGYEATKQIAALEVKSPVIIMSANVPVHDNELNETNGVSGYLKKPYTSQEFWHCLSDYFVPVTPQELLTNND